VGKSKRLEACREEVVKPPQTFMTRKQARGDLVSRKTKIQHQLYQLPFKACQTAAERDLLDHAAIVESKIRRVEANHRKSKNHRQGDRQSKRWNPRKSTTMNQENINTDFSGENADANPNMSTDKLRELKIRVPAGNLDHIGENGSLMSESITTVDDDDRLNEKFDDPWEVCEQAGVKFLFHPITGEAKPYDSKEADSAEEISDIEDGPDSFSFLDDPEVSWETYK